MATTPPKQNCKTCLCRPAFLHWLPVKDRIQLRSFCIYKCMNNATQSDWVELNEHTSQRQRLGWSLNATRLLRSRLKKWVVDSFFSVAAPKLYGPGMCWCLS